MSPQAVMAEVTRQFIEDDGVASPYEINNGSCEDWANEVKKRVSKAHTVEIWETVFCYADTTHAFVCIDGKFYDAEMPNGTDDPHNLPIFAKIGKPQPLWRIDHNGGTNLFPTSRFNFTKEDVMAYNRENNIDWIKPEDIPD